MNSSAYNLLLMLSLFYFFGLDSNLSLNRTNAVVSRINGVFMKTCGALITAGVSSTGKHQQE